MNTCLLPKNSFGLRSIFVLGLLCLFPSCFDYKEVLVFYENFSGYVELDYRVPMYPEKDRSLIAFLPVSKSRILERYKRLLRRGQIRIEDFRVEMQSVGLPLPPEPGTSGSAASENASLFRRFARVRYKIVFQDPLVLEEILPGQIRLRLRGRRGLQIERRYPVTGGLPDKANRVVSGLYRISRELLQDHKMQFQLHYAEGLSLQSNRGHFLDATQLVWNLPLASSLYEKEKIRWRIVLSKKPSG